jgi:hypothetical protein
LIISSPISFLSPEAFKAPGHILKETPWEVLQKTLKKDEKL